MKPKSPKSKSSAAQSASPALYIPQPRVSARFGVNPEILRKQGVPIHRLSPKTVVFKISDIEAFMASRVEGGSS